MKMLKAISIMVLLLYWDDVLSNRTEPQTKDHFPPLDAEWSLKQYLKKYEASVVWEKIDRQRKYFGKKISDLEQLNMMFEGMDQTDEILNFRIGTDDLKDTRRYGWQPPPGPRPNKEARDPFYLRERIYNLMRQAIYQARNRMIIMQNYRAQYRASPIYKMGFLTGKVDNACKTFAAVSYRTYKGCIQSREAAFIRFPMHDMLTANQRLLHLWYNVEIMTDLIRKNDEICKDILTNHTSHRKEIFKLEFIE